VLVPEPEQLDYQVNVLLLSDPVLHQALLKQVSLHPHTQLLTHLKALLILVVSLALSLLETLQCLLYYMY
jgi:hypothetical protein